MFSQLLRVHHKALLARPWPAGWKTWSFPCIHTCIQFGASDITTEVQDQQRRWGWSEMAAMRTQAWQRTGFVQLWERKANRGGLPFSCLMAEYKKKSNRLFSQGYSEKIRGNRHTLEYSSFWLNRRKTDLTRKMVKHWKRGPETL